MSKRMLIDSSHPEETRVVVLDGQKVEEFDFEAASKRPLKGNIYLAKVTRVEPSLQAAFVEYGGNRQGFLAFSEIHPDYYQIPVADRMALLAEQEADARRRQEDDVESFEITSTPKGPARDSEDESEDEDGSDETESEDHAASDSEGGFEKSNFDATGEDEVFSNRGEEVAGVTNLYDEEHDEVVVATIAELDDDEPADAREIAAQEINQGIVDEQTVASAAAETRGDGPSNIESAEPEITDSIPDLQTASESLEEGQSDQALKANRPPQRWMRRRHYKIQEVIKRRQIILVQVVKEERGNKGAALTTYLSLAGRYCVLMPNTPRGGGISRKITNANDRKRLKTAAQSLELPEGMGLIIRTAGESRTKVEIKRDYEYLLRLWDTIRELTLKSNAPACVYEEGDLIKRAIRDLYNKDVGEVLVEGDDGYRNAKDFMRMLMPSHAKNVKPYKEPVPLFQRHHIEAQLDAMFSPTVTLKSGGYIVINQTEALVSIDVNSGRATREHSIEETAHKTNLEAADEVGRQLRLRDLAGLIVIDFIDMEDGRNDRDVEKRLRDAVKNDRARVQIGKISQFGLLEMSRQRLRAGVIAGSTVPCPHCGGQGIVRSVESTSLRVLRGLEEEGQRLRASAVLVRVANEVAIYTLNQKRRELGRIESDYGMEIAFEPKDELLAGTFEIERTVQKSPEDRAKLAVSVEASFAPPQVEEEIEPEIIETEVADAEDDDDEMEETEQAPQGRPHEAPREPRGEEAGGRRRRRRRRRGGRGDRPVGQDQHRQQQQLPRPADEPRLEGERPIANLSNGEPHEIAADAETVPQGPEMAQVGPPGENNGQRRRRRRRRRRGRNGQDPSQPRELSGVVSEPNRLDVEARFGEADEIDTTPREEPKTTAIPNTSSSPVWSLESERGTSGAHQARDDLRRSDNPVRETVPARSGQSTTERKVEVSPEPASSRGTPPTESVPEPAGPTRRGWWQRTFRPED